MQDRNTHYAAAERTGQNRIEGGESNKKRTWKQTRRARKALHLLAPRGTAHAASEP